MTFGSGALDAFGRQRTSQPFTLFDSFHRFQDNGKINEYTAAGGNSTFDANAGCIKMNVTTANGSKIYRESTRVFAYQPGKSLLILQTFCMAEGKDDLRQRIGYYDTANGFYLQQLDTQLGFVQRSSVTGVLVNTVVNQQDWNTDTLMPNRLNPSGITLDITTTQIMFTDIEWLGVGTVRQGFVIDGQFIICHQWHHANTPGNILPYITTACLPVRSELENLAETDSASTFVLICTSVISEGGYDLKGRPRAIGMALGSPYDMDTPANTIRPLITVRLESTRLEAIVLPKEFGIMPVDNLTGKWYVIQGGTTSGGTGTWVSAGADSSVEYKMDATAIAGGNVTEAGFLQAQAFAGTRASLDIGSIFKYQLERNTFTGVAFEFTLGLEITTTNKNVYAYMNWEEIT
jgi:hypothetical protein